MSTKKSTKKETLSVFKNRHYALVTLPLVDLVKMLGKKLSDKFTITIPMFVDDDGNMNVKYTTRYQTGTDEQGRPIYGNRRNQFLVNWNNSEIAEADADNAEIAAALSEEFVKALENTYDIEFRGRASANGIEHRPLADILAGKKPSKKSRSASASEDDDLPFDDE